MSQRSEGKGSAVTARAVYKRMDHNCETGTKPGGNKLLNWAGELSHQWGRTNPRSLSDGNQQEETKTTGCLMEKQSSAASFTLLSVSAWTTSLRSSSRAELSFFPDSEWRSSAQYSQYTNFHPILPPSRKASLKNLFLSKNQLQLLLSSRFINWSLTWHICMRVCERDPWFTHSWLHSSAMDEYVNILTQISPLSNPSQITNATKTN